MEGKTPPRGAKRWQNMPTCKHSGRTAFRNDARRISHRTRLRGENPSEPNQNQAECQQSETARNHDFQRHLAHGAAGNAAASQFIAYLIEAQHLDGHRDIPARLRRCDRAFGAHERSRANEIKTALFGRALFPIGRMRARVLKSTRIKRTPAPFCPQGISRADVPFTYMRDLS